MDTVDLYVGLDKRNQIETYQIVKDGMIVAEYSNSPLSEPHEAACDFNHLEESVLVRGSFNGKIYRERARAFDTLRLEANVFVESRYEKALKFLILKINEIGETQNAPQ